jgi:hypothetical protein
VKGELNEAGVDAVWEVERGMDYYLCKRSIVLAFLSSWLSCHVASLAPSTIASTLLFFWRIRKQALIKNMS